MKKTFCTAIVLAAGSGKRMGTRIAKQYLEIDGKPLLYYTLLAFERSPQIDKIILTVGSEEQISYCQETILRPYGFQKVASVITGGKERYDSVWRGLQAVKENLPKEAAEGIAAELGIDEVHARRSKTHGIGGYSGTVFSGCPKISCVCCRSAGKGYD